MIYVAAYASAACRMAGRFAWCADRAGCRIAVGDTGSGHAISLRPLCAACASACRPRQLRRYSNTPLSGVLTIIIQTNLLPPGGCHVNSICARMAAKYWLSVPIRLLSKRTFSDLRQLSPCGSHALNVRLCCNVFFYLAGVRVVDWNEETPLAQALARLQR